MMLKLDQDLLVADGDICQVAFTTCDLAAISDATMGALDVLLSADERIRARGFRVRSAQKSFIASRGHLRRMLGAYLGEAPENVVFSYSKNGKPSLAVGPQHLAFNVSHSATTVAYAFSAAASVGIDIEHRRPLNIERLSRAALSDEESQQLALVPRAGQNSALLRLWTAKEALIKATAGSIDRIREIFADCALPATAAVAIMRQMPYQIRWQQGWLLSLDLGPEVWAAVAVVTDADHVEAWRI